MVARVFRVHSHLGHWLGIRERFDIEVILTELGRRVGIDTDTVTDEQWLEHRYDLMRQSFYQFASSRSPQIDEHLIHQLLDLWSWFWVGLEATTVFVLTGFALVAVQAYEVGLATFGGALLLAAIGLPLIRLQCRGYAIAQVKAILADSSREAVVRNAFNSLGESYSPEPGSLAACVLARRDSHANAPQWNFLIVFRHGFMRNYSLRFQTET